MAALVVFQITVCYETFAAKIALKQLFLGMCPHMLQETALVLVLLVTVLKWALFDFILIVLDHVLYLVDVVRFRKNNLALLIVHVRSNGEVAPFGDGKLFQVNVL